MSFIESLFASLAGGGAANLEQSAGDLLTRLEKIAADVIASNGNVVTAVLNVGEDFATLKQVVADARAIVDDLKALSSSAAAPVPAPVTSAPATNSPAAPVSAANILTAALQAAAAIAQGHDPFAAKPLAHTPVASPAPTEPKGGA